EPPRPAADENGNEITGNGSGEDYLYLHCELLAFANHLLAGIGDPDYPRVEGWVALPSADDPDYPIPPPWFVPEGLAVSNAFVVRAKSDDFFERRIRCWERVCTDPAVLRKLTLDELGTLIESTLHDGLRSRWASAPGAWRPDPPAAGEPIGPGWDDPLYDYLRDTYSMHVNPIYWKFYGWVQDRVEDWKLVNGVFGRDFWKSTWVGKMPEDRQPGGRCPPSPRDGAPLFAVLDDPEIGQQHVAEMEQVVSIIADAEAEAKTP
ncbi:MAG: hypothetical protein LC808_07250, partial [Actinobacteria bacterium]|nr:hypothetical protein [Actinomycetota bacterium]